MSVTDVLVLWACGLIPHKPTMGPQYASNGHYNEYLSNRQPLVGVKYFWVILSVLSRLDPSMTQWNSNSQTN